MGRVKDTTRLKEVHWAIALGLYGDVSEWESRLPEIKNENYKGRKPKPATVRTSAVIDTLLCVCRNYQVVDVLRDRGILSDNITPKYAKQMVSRRRQILGIETPGDTQFATKLLKEGWDVEEIMRGWQDGKEDGGKVVYIDRQMALMAARKFRGYRSKSRNRAPA